MVGRDDSPRAYHERRATPRRASALGWVFRAWSTISSALGVPHRPPIGHAVRGLTCPRRRGGPHLTTVRWLSNSQPPRRAVASSLPTRCNPATSRGSPTCLGRHYARCPHCPQSLSTPKPLRLRTVHAVHVSTPRPLTLPPVSRAASGPLPRVPRGSARLEAHATKAKKAKGRMTRDQKKVERERGTSVSCATSAGPRSNPVGDSDAATKPRGGSNWPLPSHRSHSRQAGRPYSERREKSLNSPPARTRDMLESDTRGGRRREAKGKNRAKIGHRASGRQTRFSANC